MSTRILDGKILAAEIRAEIKLDVERLKKQKSLQPGLASILVGDDPASHTYVANKIKACQEVGIASFHHPLPAHTTAEQLKTVIQGLNRDERVHGILLQLPLPNRMDSIPLLETIYPDKDVDGLHPFNLGQLFEYKSWAEMSSGRTPLSCTPHGVMQILLRSKISISGKRAVVLGRSKLVGKPTAMMLLAHDATVTICHSRTGDVAANCSEAEILVAAIGQARFVKPSMVKEGAVVIDVGMNRSPEGGLCGDVDFESVRLKTSAITPVPGGVGPMTVAMLLYNTLLLAKKKAATGNGQPATGEGR